MEEMKEMDSSEGDATKSLELILDTITDRISQFKGWNSYTELSDKETYREILRKAFKEVFTEEQLFAYGKYLLSGSERQVAIITDIVDNMLFQVYLKHL